MLRRFHPAVDGLEPRRLCAALAAGTAVVSSQQTSTTASDQESLGGFLYDDGTPVYWVSPGGTGLVYSESVQSVSAIVGVGDPAPTFNLS